MNNYTICKNGDWYVVYNEKGRTVWVEKTLEDCEKAISSGIIDKSIEMCKSMC